MADEIEPPSFDWSISEPPILHMDQFNVVVVSELRIIFSLFDKDHDNNISMDEVMQVMQAMGQQPDIDRLRETFQLVDLDGEWALAFAWDSGMHAYFTSSQFPVSISTFKRGESALMATFSVLA